MRNPDQDPVKYDFLLPIAAQSNTGIKPNLSTTLNHLSTIGDQLQYGNVKTSSSDSMLTIILPNVCVFSIWQKDQIDPANYLRSRIVSAKENFEIPIDTNFGD